jgi:peptidoglycan/LPS O-acetylase OafA/YrhL
MQDNNQTTNQHESLLRPVMPELDTIRGLAILGVCFYHGLYWNIDLSYFGRATRAILTGFWIGRLGVNLFFVLSGFLITGLLIDSKSRGDYYKRFYIRRILRIVPAYFLTILILICFSLAPWRFVVLSFLYASNLTPLWGIPIAYPVLWSLAVEEHFYLVWPGVIRRFAPKHLALICIGIILLSPIARLITFLIAQKNGEMSFVCNEYTWNSADGLACGGLLAVCLRLFEPTRRQLFWAMLTLLCVSLAIWITAMPWGIWTRQKAVGAALQIVPWQFLFVALLGFFLLIGSSRWKGLVHSKPLMFFGDISYGLYLYHLLFFSLVDFIARRESLTMIGTHNIRPLLLRFAIAFSFAIAVSILSRRFLENPVLSMKRRLTSS